MQCTVGINNLEGYEAPEFKYIGKEVADLMSITFSYDLNTIVIAEADSVNDYQQSTETRVFTPGNEVGEWTTLPNGDKVWRMSYTSEGALSLNFFFDVFWIPEGAKLYVYNNYIFRSYLFPYRYWDLFSKHFECMYIIIMNKYFIYSEFCINALSYSSGHLI